LRLPSEYRRHYTSERLIFQCSLLTMFMRYRHGKDDVGPSCWSWSVPVSTGGKLRAIEILNGAS